MLTRVHLLDKLLHACVEHTLRGGRGAKQPAPSPLRPPGPRWPRLKATELAERVGLRTPVHAYIDVTDKGENLVSKLGLQTVPTHVLVDKSGQVRTASESPPPSTHSNTSTPMTLPHTESGDAP